MLTYIFCTSIQFILHFFIRKSIVTHFAPSVPSTLSPNRQVNAIIFEKTKGWSKGEDCQHLRLSPSKNNIYSKLVGQSGSSPSNIAVAPPTVASLSPSTVCCPSMANWQPWKGATGCVYIAVLLYHISHASHLGVQFSGTQRQPESKWNRDCPLVKVADWFKLAGISCVHSNRKQPLTDSHRKAGIWPVSFMRLFSAAVSHCW